MRSDALTLLVVRIDMVTELLRHLGERDDSARLAKIINRIAIDRVIGEDYTRTHPGELADLIGTYPGEEAALVQIIETVSDMITEAVPDYPLPRGEWASITLAPKQ